MNLERFLPQVKKEYLQGIGMGMFVMAVFSSVWLFLLIGFLPILLELFLDAVACFLFMLFIVNGTNAIVANREYEPADDENESMKGKLRIIFLGIFISEFFLIVLIILVCWLLARNSFVVPLIGLVIGIYFFPLLKFFKKNIEYVFAGFICFISIIGLLLAPQGSQAFGSLVYMPQILVVGGGITLATWLYGLYLFFIAKQTVKNILVEKSNEVSE